MVIGTATAEGVYGMRELNGLMSAVQLEEPALSVGTKLLVKQSSMAVLLCNENALLKDIRLKRAKTRNLAAIVGRS